MLVEYYLKNGWKYWIEHNMLLYVSNPRDTLYLFVT